MTAQRINYLVQKCINHEATPDERRELLDYAGDPACRDQFLQSMEEAWERLQPRRIFNEADREKLVDLILAKEAREDYAHAAPVHPAHFLKLAWVRYAAAIIILLGAAVFFYFNTARNKQHIAGGNPVPEKADVPPGKEGAILTLADGRQVVLDSLENGVIAVQNGTRIVLKNGELAYATSEGASQLYNNLTTPKGRQFQLQLPDGTKVWMNAASSLRYPTVFSDAERRVEVTGEVYFEVARHPYRPFMIDVNHRAQIRVLGTRFNVNAYPNETAIKTTLVEGSVKFVSGDSVILKPGQQAVLTTRNATLTTEDQVDISKVLAWKSGFFNFENTSLEEVMRQIERWYDIKVVYEKGVPDIRFGGKLSNDVSLSGLLKSLQESELHCRLEGRKLIVLP